MKKIGIFLLRALVVTVAVVLLTTLLYWLKGGQTARVLSDWLVLASFVTLAAGTLMGLSKVGYKRPPMVPGEPPEGRFEHMLKEFLLVGSIGISVTLAGPLCFGVAILVDLLIK